MIQKILGRVNEKLFSEEKHLRFELGEPFANGTDERINQVTQRVVTLFEEFFSQEDEIHVLIKDWESDDAMFGDTTPNYLYELLSNFHISSEVVVEREEDLDEEDEEVRVKTSLVRSKVKDIDYKSILVGIANYEQGREPSIGQRVYFLDLNKGSLFYMYDDRGCLLYSDSTEPLRQLYHKYNSWIVDYWRNLIDSFFEK